MSLNGGEKSWLEDLGVKVPDDVALVCADRLPNSSFSGVEEDHEVIGAAAADLVASQIQHNEFGLPRRPKLILFKGFWECGHTLRPKKEAATGGLTPATPALPRAR